ncbi:MAG: hypothetical protein R3E84_12545 [Pseudomonadales bacterium]
MSSGIPVWIASGDSWLHATLHQPAGPAKAMGVVIVSPVGHEFTHSQSSVRRLCEHLSLAGYPTVRFTLQGVGNSTTLPGDHNLLDVWVRNVTDVADWLRERTGCHTLSVGGLRLGASVAALYAEQHAVDTLLLWAPCLRGARFLRDCQLVGQASSYLKASGLLDCGGLVMDGSAQHLIGAMRLTQTVPRARRVLLFDRDDAPQAEEVRAWLAPHGIDLVITAHTRYLGMMRQSMNSLIPEAGLRALAGQLSQTPHVRNTLTATPTAVVQSSDNTTDHAMRTPDGVRETLCQIGANGLFGILTEPALAGRHADLVVVIPNTGGGHHVGPCNLHVALARALAGQGIAALRFDLANLGDSVSGVPSNADQPYPRGAMTDVSEVLNYLAGVHGFTRFLAVGMCSGAYTGFRALCRSVSDGSAHEIAGALLINPAVWAWDETLVENDCLNAARVESRAAAYTEKLASGSKWHRLIRGDVSIGYAVATTVQRAAMKFGSAARRLAEHAGIYGTPLAREIRRVLDAGRTLRIYTAQGDPAADILRSVGGVGVQRMIDAGQLPVTDFADADHTFSSAASQAKLVHRLVLDCVDAAARCERLADRPGPCGLAATPVVQSAIGGGD